MELTVAACPHAGQLSDVGDRHIVPVVHVPTGIDAEGIARLGDWLRAGGSTDRKGDGGNEEGSKVRQSEHVQGGALSGETSLKARPYLYCFSGKRTIYHYLPPPHLLV